MLFVPKHLVCDHRIPCVPHWPSFPKGLARQTNDLGCIKSTPIQSNDTNGYKKTPKNHTHRHVGKGTADKRCPDVFGVRKPNNGRVLAAAISHQVVHVALPGHVCEIIFLRWGYNEGSGNTSLRRRLTARKRFYHWFDGPPANKSPPAQQRPGFLLVGNEEKLLLSDRRMGVVLIKSLRLGRCSPRFIIA